MPRKSNAFLQQKTTIPNAGAGVIHVTAPAPFAQYYSPVYAAGTTLDCSGETFYMRYSENPNPDGNPCHYDGGGKLTYQLYPFRVTFGNATVRYGKFKGDISLTTPSSILAAGAEGYCNSAMILMDHATSTVITADSCRIDQCWDGLRLGSFAQCMYNPGSCNNIIKDCWVSNCRDDAIENDHLGGLTVSRCLFDGVFSLVSANPGGCPTCPDHGATDTMLFEDCLIRMEGWSAVDTPLQGYHISHLKIFVAQAPAVVMNNCTVYMDEYYTDPGENTQPAWSAAFNSANMSGTNNRFLYSRGASLPTGFPTPHASFTVVLGAAAAAEWAASKAAWIAAHPLVERFPGDLQSDNPPTISLITDGVAAANISLVRATSASYCNSSGVLAYVGNNVLRKDYHPTTFVLRGMLIEQTRTNLILRSEEFDNAAWVKTGCSVSANAIAAPDGATTADKIVEDSANSQHGVDQTVTKAASALPYTFYVYIKSSERTKHQIAILDSAGANGFSAAVDTAAGTIGSATVVGSGWTAGSTRIEYWAASGFYRAIIRGTSTTDTTVIGRYRLADSGGAVTYTGNGTSGAHVWGAQLEQNSLQYEGSYVPTTTAAVTYNSDNPEIFGANLTGFYNQSAGTWFAIATAAPQVGQGANQHLIDVNDTTANEHYYIRRGTSSTSVTWFVNDGNVDQVDQTIGTWQNLTRGKVAAAYSAGSFAAAFNGVVTTDSAGTLPTITQVQVGTSLFYTNRWQGWIEDLQYWNTRKANTFLQTITSFLGDP